MAEEEKELQTSGPQEETAPEGASQEAPQGEAAPQDGEQGQPEKEKKKPLEDLFYWLNALTTALVFLVVVFTFLGRITRVDGVSMEQTLHDRQLLLVWSLGYEPQQGDIVVLNKSTVEHLGGVAIIKRVIATEGQTVDIDYATSTVYVDGEVLDEPYVWEEMYPPANSSSDHFEVPEGSVFVMGDNRNNSDDSRDDRIGPIDTRYILGKAVFSIFPFSSIGPVG